MIAINYFMMGIKKNNDNDKYFVSTLSAPTDPKDTILVKNINVIMKGIIKYGSSN